MKYSRDAIRMATLEIPHGGLLVLNEAGGGSKPKKIWHCAKDCPDSIIVACDVIPLSGASNHLLQGGCPNFITTNECSEQFVRDKLRGNVALLRTPAFDTNWYTDGGILDQLQNLIRHKKLTPVCYKRRGAHSSGIATKKTIEALREIPEFRQYIEQLQENFAIRSFWVLVHGSDGEHDWHPDTFIADATHRFILSLGCSREGGPRKTMGFAHYKDVSKL